MHSLFFCTHSYFLHLLRFIILLHKSLSHKGEKISSVWERNLVFPENDSTSQQSPWSLKVLSTSIYDLVLLNVCHFHHHPQGFWKSIEILVLTSWILNPRIFHYSFVMHPITLCCLSRYLYAKILKLASYFFTYFLIELQVSSDYLSLSKLTSTWLLP